MLFGSVARGDDNEQSDIDILIVSPMQIKSNRKFIKSPRYNL